MDSPLNDFVLYIHTTYDTTIGDCEVYCQYFYISKY